MTIFVLPYKFLIKTLNSILLFCLIIASLSCGNFTEEITLQKDGSGDYAISLDLISFAKISVRTGLYISEMFPSNPYNTNHDSVVKWVEEDIWKDYPELVDSTFDCSGDINDSVRNHIDNQIFIKNMKCFINADKTSNHLHMGIRYHFEDLNNLKRFISFLHQHYPLMEDSEFSVVEFAQNAEYNFSKGHFRKKSTQGNMAEEALQDSSSSESDNLVNEITYTTIINMPSEIKKVKGKNLVSQEKNQVTFVYPLIEFVEDNRISDIEVFLKK